MTFRAPPGRFGGRQPILNLPPMVGALIGACVLVFVVMLVLPQGIENWVLFNFGFIPARYQPGAFGWPAIAAPLGHQFLHAGVLHLVINMVMLAAFGAGVERALGGPRTLLIFLVSGIAGAFTHLAFYPDSIAPVVGASGSISGLFGAVLRLMASRPLARGGVRLLPVAVIWIGFAVLTGIVGAPGAEGVQIAWAAHVGGFVTGLVLLPLLARRVRRRGRFGS